MNFITIIFINFLWLMITIILVINYIINEQSYIVLLLKVLLNMTHFENLYSNDKLYHIKILWIKFYKLYIRSISENDFIIILLPFNKRTSNTFKEPCVKNCIPHPFTSRNNFGFLFSIVLNSITRIVIPSTYFF